MEDKIESTLAYYNQKRKYCDFEIVNANNLALLGQVESLIEGLKK